jgi:phosphodiesterase/alkaline phosphatase D-like protein
VTAKMHKASTDVRLVIDGTTITAAESTDADRCVRFDLTGLAADTEYTYQVQLDGDLVDYVGRFKTAPAAPGVACNFMFALAGDAETASISHAFHRVRMADPLFFLHLGDLHYLNIATNTPSAFQAAYDQVFTLRPQAMLYREVPTVYVWDDHDFGANNANGTSPSRPAAGGAYRSRVPHYPLVDSVSIHHTFDIGRVRFIVTDQRSNASPDSDTDNSSKTMLGAAQKTWFKGLISSSPNMLIVWVCPRIFGGSVVAGADHWGGFSTERTELCDHIQANAPGRVVVLSADGHYLAIDDGTNHDFVTAGSEPLQVFQCAPLDKVAASPGSGATYSEGTFTNDRQFGTMAVTDAGGSTIDVEWKGFNDAGTTLITHTFTVTL